MTRVYLRQHFSGAIDPENDIIIRQIKKDKPNQIPSEFRSLKDFVEAECANKPEEQKARICLKLYDYASRHRSASQKHGVPKTSPGCLTPLGLSSAGFILRTPPLEVPVKRARLELQEDQEREFEKETELEKEDEDFDEDQNEEDDEQHKKRQNQQSSA